MTSICPRKTSVEWMMPPKVICAETLAIGTTKVMPEIAEYMATQGYVARGGSIVNTIFIDSKIL